VSAPSDPQGIAEQSARAMWANDRASQQLGMTVVSVAPGQSQVAMTISESMVNGHGIAHGGFIFALADSAFAFACNGHGAHAVAAQCQISYLRPSRLGDRLVASAREIVREGRSGIYDVRVTRGDEVVAEFRGHSRQVPGSWVKPPRD
jgi:acyl-CoA thioesterase